jgi:tRNA dimethylallyltransferase
MNRAAPNLIAIVGTNASGKSALGVDLASRLGAEVISADSRQVFRGLDIGTGKLTDEEMRGVQHHLIDIRDPTEFFSLADFQRLAYESINEIAARGKQPILVGGTALYLRAAIDGYELVDAPYDPERRQALESLETEELARRLAELDSTFATKLDPRNRTRVIRAIEVIESGHAYEDTRRSEPRFETLQLGLTWPRDVLRARIDDRLRHRLEHGMIEEVKALLEAGVPDDVLHRLGLEYRFVLRFLTGEYTDVDELFERLRVAIHRFARRQLSWFLKDSRIHWLDTNRDYSAEAERLSRDFAARVAV